MKKINTRITAVDFRREDLGLFQDPPQRAVDGSGEVQDNWLVGLLFNGKPAQSTRMVHDMKAVRKTWQKATWINRKPLSDLKCKKEVQRRWKQGQAFCDECKSITPKLRR